MPNDIIKEDVEIWKRIHDMLTFDGVEDVPIDVTCVGCYLGEKCEKEKLLTNDETEILLWELGGQSSRDRKGTWKRAMEKYDELKKNKAGSK